MTTKTEFMEIVEKHITVTENGAYVIKDPALAKKYTEYIEMVSNKDVSMAESMNAGCVNIWKCE